MVVLAKGVLISKLHESWLAVLRAVSQEQETALHQDVSIETVAEGLRANWPDMNWHSVSVIVEELIHEGLIDGTPTQVLRGDNGILLVPGLTPKGRALIFDRPSVLKKAARKVHLVTEVNVSGDLYTAGQAGAMGPQSHAHDMTFQQLWHQTGGNIDLAALAQELSVLRQHMKKDAADIEQDMAVGAVAAAEQAARAKDGPKVMETLKSTGQWALSVAEKIGVNVASQAIRAALGLG